MFAPKFDYQKAASVAEAIHALANNSEAKVLAGGQSLIPLLKLRLARPALVVDIGGIAELKGISVNGGTVSIGSMTTHNQIASSSQVQQSCGILAEAAEGVGDPAVRNRGTIGGNVSHADPASDLPTVLTALNAQFNIQGQGNRSVAASDFFTGAFTTALGDNEILTGVEVPVLAANQLAEYAKMAHPATSFRRSGRGGRDNAGGRQSPSLHRRQHRRRGAGAQPGESALGGGGVDGTGTHPRVHRGGRRPGGRRPGLRHHRRHLRVGRLPPCDGRHRIEARAIPRRGAWPTTRQRTVSRREHEERAENAEISIKASTLSVIVRVLRVNEPHEDTPD